MVIEPGRDPAAKRFTDEQARAILARAIEIESSAPMTSAEDLRAIAADVGVSQASLEEALREQTALETRRTVAAGRAANIVAASGVPLGVAAGTLLAAGTPDAMLGLMGVGLAGLAASGGLVVLEGRAGTLRSFHLKNLALWGGAAAGSLASAMLVGGDVTVLPALMTTAWCARRWITSSILGSAAMIAVRRARRPDDPSDRGETDTSGSRYAGRWTAVAKRLLGRVARPLRRNAERVNPRISWHHV